MSIYWLLSLESEILAGTVVPGESVHLEVGSLARFVKTKKEMGNGDALGELLFFWKETKSWAYTFPPKFLKKRKGKQDDNQKKK